MDPLIRGLLQRAELAVSGGRFGEAVWPLREAVSRAPLSAAVQHDLGFVCLKLGLLGEAGAAFRTSVTIDPGFAPGWLRLGVVLQATGDGDGALEACRRAVDLDASMGEAWYRAGTLLEVRGRGAEALAAFRAGALSPTVSGRLAGARVLLAERRFGEAETALRAIPEHLEATALLGTVLADLGRLAEARECYARVTGASPHYAGCFYDLVRCGRVTDPELVSRMRAAVEADGMHPETRLKVHLAIGKAVDDLGDHREAMAQYDLADAIRSGIGRFEADAFEGLVERIAASFGRERFTGRAEIGPAPILIVGLPRSGTTLVEQILSCHPDVDAGGEMPFWTALGADWERVVPERAGADYAEALREIGHGRVTDKMPLNLLWAGLVCLSVPRATIVHVRRCPIDTAVSIHRTYFNPRLVLPTGGRALVRAVRAVEKLAAHWREVLPAGRLVEVEYERLVTEPEPVVRELLDACGLQWDGACLRPDLNERVVSTPSKWQVRQPISPASVGVWRRYEPWLGDLAELVAD